MLMNAVLSQESSSQNVHVFMAEEASRFAASDIRRAISYWVSQNRLDLADALVDAGMSLHPTSEDILAIGALLAEVNQNWAQAQDCLERLMVVQGKHLVAETCHHLVRVMRCRGAYFNAYRQAQKSLEQFPQHEGLMQAHAELSELLDSVPVQVKVEALVG